MTNFRKRVRTSTAAALAAAALGGCKDFISTSDAVNNPNFPSSATANQRLTGVEIGVEELLTGDPARTIALWMQQYAGTDRQYLNTALYAYGEDLTDGYWSTIYQGGGLTDIRSVKTTSDAAGDNTSAGIARVLEALLIGTAADWYGDVPYTKAFDPGVKATFDPQASVYQAAQDTLSRAIQQLSSGNGTGSGPQAADILYNGDAARWARLAHSLKARFYLHTAERKGTAADGTPAFDPAVYQRVLAEAQQGIQAGQDFRTYQSTNLNEANLLYQFNLLRTGYASPDSNYVALLQSRNDPRLTTYFAPGSSTTAITGSISGNSVSGTSAVFASTGIGGAGYRWTMVGYGETQLMIAEANYRLGNTAAALAAYNNERTAAGLPASTGLPAGPAGLREIMTEKYVALVQNPEVWQDYHRTCVPQILPQTAAGTGATIPSRFLYPNVEKITNPTNIPPDPPRNPNDPNPCSVGGTQTSD